MTTLAVRPWRPVALTGGSRKAMQRVSDAVKRTDEALRKRKMPCQCGMCAREG